MTWWQALIAAGAVPGNGRKTDEPETGEQADVVEGLELHTHPLPEARIPNPVSFLNGIERWGIVAHDGIVQVVSAYIAAAVRRRGATGTLHTTMERSRSFAVAPLDRMSAAPRRELEQAGVDVEPIDGDLVEQPARYLETVESTVRRARAHLERELAESAVQQLGDDEWLLLDGRLSRAPAVARHPRALGVIKSHGAQFLEGRGLERALTLPAGHRTSVFAVRGGHTRTEVYSWYVRLWPWEGNDLLYGLLRVEARAHPETIAQAPFLSAWLYAERAPLATPATRWDRLLYPLHHVEEYLKARAPRDLQSHRASRLPRTGT
ncbi:MAG TPA: hypothetical protein VIV83_10535 [Gemmatimonadales bacterium]|jgi:hypothetical protein